MHAQIISCSVAFQSFCPTLHSILFIGPVALVDFIMQPSGFRPWFEADARSFLSYLTGIFAIEQFAIAPTTSLHPSPRSTVVGYSQVRESCRMTILACPIILVNAPLNAHPQTCRQLLRIDVFRFFIEIPEVCWVLFVLLLLQRAFSLTMVCRFISRDLKLPISSRLFLTDPRGMSACKHGISTASNRQHFLEFPWLSWFSIFPTA